jgi:hypothetical protein
MGWPAVIVALFVYLVALILRHPRLGIVAVLISTPFCLYVSLYPQIWGLGVVALGCNFLGIAALSRRRIILAAACWVPFVVLASVIASWVLQQATMFR